MSCLGHFRQIDFATASPMPANKMQQRLEAPTYFLLIPEHGSIILASIHVSSSCEFYFRDDALFRCV